jgi:hypothetical protein
MSLQKFPDYINIRVGNETFDSIEKVKVQLEIEFKLISIKNLILKE